MLVVNYSAPFVSPLALLVILHFIDFFFKRYLEFPPFRVFQNLSFSTFGDVYGKTEGNAITEGYVFVIQMPGSHFFKGLLD